MSGFLQGHTVDKPRRCLTSVSHWGTMRNHGTPSKMALLKSNGTKQNEQQMLARHGTEAFILHWHTGHGRSGKPSSHFSSGLHTLHDGTAPVWVCTERWNINPHKNAYTNTPGLATPKTKSGNSGSWLTCVHNNEKWGAHCSCCLQRSLGSVVRGSQKRPYTAWLCK